MKNTDKKHIYTLFDTLLDLCEEKGLSAEEAFVIGAMTDDEKTIEKFGEEEALRLAIGVIELCENGDQIFLALERLFGFDEEN